MAGPTTFNELITQLNAVLNNFAQAVGQDVVSGNTVDVTDFSKATGTYINTPNAPWTESTIPLNYANLAKGGISTIWYKGPVLNKNSFTGGTITMFSGANVSNELCRVFIDVDASSGAFSVNIQTGFTGDLPGSGIEPGLPVAPTNMSLTEGDLGVPLAPTNLSLTEGTF